MRKKRKGFTLVELLVVIAIIALLMGILMPALARVRAIAFRVVCGTNLSGLGKAMLIYANDYEDELPQAGYPGSTYRPSLMAGWKGPRFQAYDAGVTVSSSLYLLIKYTEVGPKQFVCRGTDTTEFKIPPGTMRPPGNTEPLELVDAFDFLDTPIQYCSYSYHSAYNSPFALNVASSNPGMAMAADRNPWLDPAALSGELAWFKPDVEPWNGTVDEAKWGNALAHGGDGQNVLFLDSHVAYEKRCFCGVMDDNIYTPWANTGGVGKEEGNVAQLRGELGGTVPLHKADSVLVNEGEAGAGGGTTNGTTNGTTDGTPIIKPYR